jgi:beta-glucosidase-like glycosyl hydrolase
MKEISGSKNSKKFSWALRGLAVFGVVSLLVLLFVSLVPRFQGGSVDVGRSPEERASLHVQQLAEAKRRMMFYDNSMFLAERYAKGDGVLKDFKLADQHREEAQQHGQAALTALRRAGDLARSAEQVQAVIDYYRADRRLRDDRLLGKCYLKAALLGVPGAADRLAEDLGLPATNLSPTNSQTESYLIYVYGLLNVCSAKTHHQKCAQYRDELARQGAVASEVGAQSFSRELMQEIEAELK